MIGVLTIHLHLSSCKSSKRNGAISQLFHACIVSSTSRQLKWILQDAWQQAVIGCGMVGE
jgi:hypothetical protein